MTIFLKGLEEIARRFDGFLVDQWGVLHNGVVPYPGALQALRQLKAQGRRIVLLSNSGRRRHENAERLARLGFEAGDTYDALVTSGEVAADLLRERRDPFFAALGRRCLLIGPAVVLDGMDFDVVHDAESADFVLLASTQHAAFARDEARRLLSVAAKKRLPLICSNPDFASVIGGHKSASPGELARYYTELGGSVRLVGKPTREVFAVALTAAGMPAARTAVVGDSLEHDIAGGHRAGLRTVFIMGGIHANDLPANEPASQDALVGLAARFGVRPDYALPTFRW